MSDFVTELTNFITSYIPTNRSWAEACALSTLSTVVGGSRFVNTSIGKLRLNLFHIYIGASGIAHKTSPLKNVVFPILSRASEIAKWDFILPSQFSMEGLIEYLSQHAEGIIIRDEVSSFFKELQGSKSYLPDLPEIMSQLYDGTVQKRYTRKAKLEKVLNCYINFIGASTPYLYDVMDMCDFIQGVGNRILWEVWKKQENHSFTLFPERKFLEERDAKIDEFAEKLVKLRNSMFTQLEPDPNVKSQIDRFKSEWDMKAHEIAQKDVRDLRCGYYARVGELCIKLAGLYTISRLWEVLPSSRLGEVLITQQDFERAKSRMEHYIQQFEQLLVDWRTQPETPKPVSHKFSKDAFVDVVRRKGIITRAELLKITGWYLSPSFYQLESTVLEEGEVKKLSAEEIEALPLEIRAKIWKGGSGRLPTVYAYVGKTI